MLLGSFEADLCPNPLFLNPVQISPGTGAEWWDDSSQGCSQELLSFLKINHTPGNSYCHLFLPSPILQSLGLCLQYKEDATFLVALRDSSCEFAEIALSHWNFSFHLSRCLGVSLSLSLFVLLRLFLISCYGFISLQLTYTLFESMAPTVQL